jgi:two-component system response regulator AtoC
MSDSPRQEFVALIQAASAVVPVASLGCARRLDDGRLSVLCASRHGLNEYVLPLSEAPDALQPSDEARRDVASHAIASNVSGALEFYWRLAGVQRVVSLGLAESEYRARFWIGLSEDAPLSERQVLDLDAVRRNAADTLNVITSSDQTEAQLRRLERAAGLLPALLEGLDVRAVFERLSAISDAALPHDMLTLGLFNDELTVLTLYVRTGATSEERREFEQPYPPSLTRSFEFDILYDRTSYPLERDRPPTTQGMRSSLRLPLRYEGRVVGGLGFHSREPFTYSTSDVVVARRLADHVAVGFIHYRLAEEGRRTAALQERAANLEMLDGLLAALADVLDIRDVFERVSSIAQKMLRHDAAALIELVDTGDRVRYYSTQGLGSLHPTDEISLETPRPLTDPREFQLVEDLREQHDASQQPAMAAGMRAAVSVPVRVEGRVHSTLNFYSTTRGHFTRDDVVVVRRIADHVALALSHERLADHARRNQELRARATNLELLDELLAALIDSGELRDVFGRISAIAAKVLPHDAATLFVVLPDGLHGRLYASRGFNPPLPAIMEVPEELRGIDWDHHILDDISGLTSERYVRLQGMGFQSLLRIAIRLEGTFAGALVFVSAARAAFTPPDVLIGRRIADRLAVTMAREREIDASRRADEATARASRLEARVRALTDELDTRTGYRRVIGESAQWRDVLRQAAQVAATDTTVLLLGESGTGKEVVARFLHRGSSRNAGPFIALNCAALPEQLLEAELFGYERGAYTGATQSKPGQLEQAAGGTLLLDEVGEMSPSAQAKFLRVLQEREFQRLGGTRVLRTDARIVAATNRDLQKAIAHGQFREDLYYRLNVFAIRLPPLRDRRDDILPLSEAFVTEIGRGLGRPPGGISRDARELLVRYPWPGNVRELRNILERAAILCDGGLIAAEHLALTEPSPAPPPLSEALSTPDMASVALAGAVPPVAASNLQDMERAMIEQALQRARFNKSKAAKALGLTRHQLYLRMQKYDLT